MDEKICKFITIQGGFIMALAGSFGLGFALVQGLTGLAWFFGIGILLGIFLVASVLFSLPEKISRWLARRK